jgi:hypothetical protein
MKITSYKNRELNYSELVQIYRHTGKTGWVFSVKQKNKVVAHATELILEECSFLVNQNGRERVLKNIKKFPHAFICGKVCASKLDKKLELCQTRITYNPYKYDSFVDESGFKVEFAEKVWIGEGGVFRL